MAMGVRLEMMMMPVVMVVIRGAVGKLGRKERRDRRGLAPGEHEAEERNSRKGDELDVICKPRHADGCRAQDQGRREDDADRHERLQQRRRRRQDDAAPQGLFIGDEIGRDHRLAVARPARVEHAIGEGEEDHAEREAVIVARRLQRGLQLPVEPRLLGEDPAPDAGAALGCLADADAERVLRRGGHSAGDERAEAEDDERREAERDERDRDPPHEAIFAGRGNDERHEGHLLDRKLLAGRRFTGRPPGCCRRKPRPRLRDWAAA